MQINTILDRVERKIQDDSYDRTDDLLPMVNKGLREIAVRVKLPDLFTHGTVTCAADGFSATMPTDYMAYLAYAHNTTHDTKVKVWRFSHLMARFPSLDISGWVSHVAAKGSTLYFQPCPKSDETLRIFYNKAPTEFTADNTDTIEYIPEQLQEGLLVSYAVREVFNEIEDGIEEKKVNWNTYNKLFEENISKLHMLFGPAEHPAEFIPAESEHYGMGYFSESGSDLIDEIL